ncbi:peptide deformylase [Candidatus Palibaumannia cicadellinicola]|uniref:Peptide deformylase n=1 Tax=Candidatus Palibaumannia cicadellinicola TaxID=186490 RepID=A0A2N4XWZ3_9GAMM|nr:peptide deformylase [Candidatus Baumannia cicadellinicola]PLK58777.1 peptide deformylase [Candidatus Baumannia cicadellinicola]
MSILPILHYPDDRLRKISKPVTEINDTIHLIVYNMFDTMYANKGIGLAAPQVDINLRIIVIDVSENQVQRLVLINPELLDKSGQTGIDEGCLSIPNQYYFVPRAKYVKVRAQDLGGNYFQLETNNIQAICIQHEMDHLIGKLFVDYLSPLKQKLIGKKMNKMARIRSAKT